MLLKSILGLFFPQDLVLQMVELKDLIIDLLPDDREKVLDTGDVLMLLLRLHQLIEGLMFGAATFLDVLHQFYQLNEDVDD